MNAQTLSRTLIGGLILAVCGALPAHAQWPQWGGPNRDFTVKTKRLADTWPDKGPKRLWHKRLGSGYSAIVYDDGVLYTMYRKRKKDIAECTAALDAKTGKPIWVERNRAPIPEGTEEHGRDFTGPNATPLIVDDRLYTLGRNADLYCRRKTDGSILWHHDLQKDFGAQIMTCGYSCSPIAYENTLIIPIGHVEGDSREGQSLVAFDQLTGKVLWRKHTFEINHSSPILIKLGEQDQYVLCTNTRVIGVNPKTGDLLWEYPMPGNPQRGLVASPVWNGKDTIVYSDRKHISALKLTKTDKGTSVEQRWSDNNAGIAMGTPIVVGDMLVCGKHMDNLQGAFMGMDIPSGKRLWIEREFPSPVQIGGQDGKLIVLDCDGNPALAGVSRDGLTVHSKCQVAERFSFTVPTLVGKRLYIRDEKHIMAYDVGKAKKSKKKGKAKASGKTRKPKET